MKPAILFRKDSDTETEFLAARDSKIYTTVSRILLPFNSVVIGRYSVLPFYQDLEIDLKLIESRLINSYEEHRYIADILNWYEDIKEFTPKTYATWENLYEGKWIVKGKTNSRKHQWNTMMYAEGRDQLLNVIKNLYYDQLISSQGLVVREYVPLKRVDTAINGLPVTREWRCFFFKEELIESGYYWASHPDCDQGELPEEGLDFVKQVAKIIAKKTNFFVLDVAEKEEGGWVIIEVNDGQMSGLSMIDPIDFYKNLYKVLKGKF